MGIQRCFGDDTLKVKIELVSENDIALAHTSMLQKCEMQIYQSLGNELQQHVVA